MKTRFIRILIATSKNTLDSGYDRVIRTSHNPVTTSVFPLENTTRKRWLLKQICQEIQKPDRYSDALLARAERGAIILSNEEGNLTELMDVDNDYTMISAAFTLPLYTLATAFALPSGFQSDDTQNAPVAAVSIIQHDLDDYSNSPKNERPNPAPYTLELGAWRIGATLTATRQNSASLQIGMEIDGGTIRAMAYAGDRDAPIAFLKTDFEQSELQLNSDRVPEERKFTIPYNENDPTEWSS